MKKHLLFVIYCLFSITLISCTNSLGKKGEWNATYKQKYLSDCKAEINKKESLGKMDSTIILKICDCITSKVEKEFEPLETEKENAQTQITTISTECARDIFDRKSE